MLACLREIAYIAAMGSLQIQAFYVESKANVLPDLLSRIALDSQNEQIFHAKAAHLNLKKKEVPKEMFDGAEQIEVGVQFHAQSPDGQAVVVTVVEVKDDVVVI